MKQLTNILIAGMIVTLLYVPPSNALDFDKEIQKQESVTESLREELSSKDKSDIKQEESNKKQDFQVVLVPKSRTN